MNVYLLVSTKEKLERKIASLSRADLEFVVTVATGGCVKFLSAV